MRIVILSDIHSNLVALDAVLAGCGDHDAIWCLGDTIGYGPKPNECVERLSSRRAIALSGNHDLACIGRVDLAIFNPIASFANRWNGQQLNAESRQWLDALPSRRVIDERTILAHGSPIDPIWEYLLTSSQARESFAAFTGQLCLVGHSHLPLAFTRHPDGSVEGPSRMSDGDVITLSDPQRRYIINPGSVGQPRNHDPRAAYAIFDTEHNTISFARQAYDIAATQQQMRAAGLPDILATRLNHGV
jgi:diadenosine tetraphosphatase ApaH/serine/threonine PP2A family protein phosphatase